ncbi:MAG TPA: ABC transporter ATP-binding protein [Actinomycetota bacterium]|nr:ABC transporter ATP-binding protein [Actinomycetota bacterium]
MSIFVEAVSKTYRVRRHEPVRALSGIDLEAHDGELVVVVGPSGSGKTTLLRCVAGLEHPDSGRIDVGGSDVTDLPPGERDVAMVFQEYALFPHLSVRDNIGFGLLARRQPKDQVATKVDNAAMLMGIRDALDRRPAQLSGGERQRVALARAIVRSPAAFLLDEPLSDLDAELRTFMRSEIRALQRRLETTTLYVTHDQTEALTMGDRVAILRGGRVEQFAAPADIYARPASTFVARFIGTPPMNVVPAGLLGAGDGFAGLRPEHVRITPDGAGRLQGRVVHEDALGHEVIVHVAVGDEVLLARSPVPQAPGLHATTGLDYDDTDVYAFNADGKARP